MSKRKRPASEESEADWGSDEFDVEPGFTDLAPDSPAPRKSSVILTADQVVAVRFHTTRPGYSFEQVEIFVDQVKETLAALENALYEKDVALYESKEEQGDLQDRIATLAATIEVFRAKGDPVLKSDGSYLTESQQVAAGPEVNELRDRLKEATEELARAKMEVSSLQTEISRLAGQLQMSEQQRNEAEEAEEELRRYIDDTLGPWLAAQSRKEESAPQEPVQAGAEEELLIPIDTPEVHASNLPDEDASVDQSSLNLTAGNLGGDDWGADAPSIGGANIDVAEEVDISSVEPALAQEETIKPPARRKAKLIDAPELKG